MITMRRTEDHALVKWIVHGAIMNDKLPKIGSLGGMPSNRVRRILESNDVGKVIKLVTFYQIKRSKAYFAYKK